MQILVSGSVAYDRIMTFPGKFADHILPEKIHILNVCFTVDSLEEQFGGTAGNIAYSLALLGEKPLILSTVGKDFDAYADWLKQHQLSLEGIRRVDDEFTAGAYITTDQMSNQITGFNPGAMNHICGFDLDKISEKAAAIVAPGNPADMRHLCAAYRQRQIPYIYDPGQQIPITPAADLTEMITGAAVLISNDYELEMIQKATGLNTSQLLERTGIIVTTLGEQGVRVTTAADNIEVPAARAATVKDPTGAGDAFRSGFMYGWVREQSLTDCSRLGAVVASFAVEKTGTQVHGFKRKDVVARYLEAYSEPPAGFQE